MAAVASGSRARVRFTNRFTPAMGWRAWALHHAWVLPILAVAAWLRFVGIGSHFLYGDEAEYGIVARYLAGDPTYLAYPNIENFGAVPFVSQPPLMLYLMAISYKLFGPGDISMLLPSLVLGTATVLVVYAMGHRLGGRVVGLAAAAVLAVSPFHIEMSRKAMLDAGYVFFLVLTAYFLVAWMQSKRTSHAVGVGVAATCAALSKLPGALACIVSAIALAYVLAVTLARPGERADAKRVAKQAGWGLLPVGVGLGLYVGLMMYLSALRDLLAKLGWQLGRVTANGAQQDVTGVSRDFTFYLTDPQFGFRAELLPAVFVIAIIGFAICAYRFARAPVHAKEHLVPLLFVVVLAGFFLYSDRKEGFYLLPFAPFAAIGIGYAADGLRAMLSWAGLRVSALKTRAAVVGVALAIVLVLVPAYASASTSYDQFVRGNNPQDGFGAGTKEAALWIQAHDPTATQYGTTLGRFTLYYYNGQPTYHYYVDVNGNHQLIDQKIKEGKLRYVVYDEYLGNQYDTAYMRTLIGEYHGVMVADFQKGWGDVRVFELHP